ncbi:hypothetical protein FKW77_006534 [Venturia effusa]|uniref:J domain-containing protein n=1 Tax=Venturia effusa TaxID=50376 RepID=A0A517LHE1_9PEZI|nr:hypothetical protein FKW77_006534 [Venturia effusa]
MSSGETEYHKARPSKFRFKSQRRERSVSPPQVRRHKKRKRTYHEPLDDDPAAYDDSFYADPRHANYIDPDTAFRESLFDALADDEGAAYWEGVYGQPIHTYPNVRPGPQGELEQMTEEEYAEHVRSKMWEKSHEYLAEERRKRQEERKRKKQREKKEEAQADNGSSWREEAERQAFEEKIAKSLRNGEQRKLKKRWQDAWQRYSTGWEKFIEVLVTKSKEDGALAGKASRGIIPWPVETGSWKNATKEDVEDFFRNAPPSESDWASILKAERVRWHPDKMQQRFGANKLDEETIRTVTAVFQVIDRLYAERRK